MKRFYKWKAWIIPAVVLLVGLAFWPAQGGPSTKLNSLDNMADNIDQAINASGYMQVTQVDVTAPVEKTPVLITQFIATASTAEALIGSETFARSVHLQAKKATTDNTGNIFIGLSGLDQGTAEVFELAPGDSFDLDMPAGTKIDLNDIYIDADTNNDGVVGWYIPI